MQDNKVIIILNKTKQKHNIMLQFSTRYPGDQPAQTIVIYGYNH